jgi:hypothetical protein
MRFIGPEIVTSFNPEHPKKVLSAISANVFSILILLVSEKEGPENPKNLSEDIRASFYS